MNNRFHPSSRHGELPISLTISEYSTDRRIFQSSAAINIENFAFLSEILARSNLFTGPPTRNPPPKESHGGCRDKNKNDAGGGKIYFPSRVKRFYGDSTVCATPELGSAKIRRRNPRLQTLWERGAISPPRDPHEPNVGLVIFYCVFNGLPGVCVASVPKRPCGVRTSHHVVY